MANLTNQQIKDTYYGLLNLNTATTGVTSTPQAITDGLGNNTGLKIATNYFYAPNVPNVQNNNNPQYMGVGVGAGSSINAANSQNRLIYGYFYDPGLYSYSAISYNLLTASTTSDVVSFSIYTGQLVDGYGLAPKDLVVSGISMTSTGTTGLKTTTFSPSFSLSGTGGGYYVYAFTISNSGVTPTARYNIKQFSDTPFMTNYGFYNNTASTGYNVMGRTGQNQVQVLTNIQSSYTTADIASYWVNVIPVNWGFVLHTVR